MLTLREIVTFFFSQNAKVAEAHSVSISRHEKFVVVKLKGQLEKEFISITGSLKKKME
jgi:hypothetical protein